MQNYIEEQSCIVNEVDRIKWCEKVDDFQGKKVLILGDIGLDEYITGEVNRISPEAPVPILKVNSKSYRIGLSGNVAQNISGLGGIPLLFSIIGQDHAGKNLKTMLEEQGVSSTYLIEDQSRPTTLKTRYMSGPNHLVRVDYEERKFLSQELEDEVLEKIGQSMPNVDIVILEDYSKGVLSKSLCDRVIGLAHSENKKVLVDPAPMTPLSFYENADLMTPNEKEAFQLSNVAQDGLFYSEDSFYQVGSEIISKTKLSNLVMTRGEKGMSLFSNDSKKITHIPTFAKTVFDVTGAGDTVIATIALAQAANHDLETACVLANYAAGVVVGEVGCVAVSSQALKKYINN